MADVTVNVTPELQKTIDKVRKLLALSAGSKEENEVKAAATAADRLMQEHRISQAMLESQGALHVEPMVKRIVSEGGRRTAWREFLLQALALHYGCAWYLSSYRTGGCGGRGGGEGSKGVQSYTVVGHASDTEIVAYMFTHLEGEIERLCRWHSGGEGVRFAASWLVGAAQGVAVQFSDMRAAARAQAQVNAQGESTSAALVILDKRKEDSDAYMRSQIGTKKASAVHGAQDYNARAKGYDVGKNLPIRQGLPAATTTTAKLGA